MQDPLWIKSLLGVHIAAGATAFLMARLLWPRRRGQSAPALGKILFLVDGGGRLDRVGACPVPPDILFGISRGI